MATQNMSKFNYSKELGKRKDKFAVDIASLIIYAQSKGYILRFQPEHINHKKNSLHFIGLAKDFDLFIDGKYITKSDAPEYIDLGAYWESLSTEDIKNCWGGNFDFNKDGIKFDDGNHFSIEFQGGK